MSRVRILILIRIYGPRSAQGPLIYLSRVVPAACLTDAWVLFVPELKLVK